MNKKFFTLLILSMFVPALQGHAELREQVINYKDGDVQLEGFLAVDASNHTPRPGILVVHDWMGISDDTKERVRMLARLGYTAFAADIYGKGKRPKDTAEAAAMAGALKADPATMRSRAAAALKILMTEASVNPKDIAAMGYCFGGTVALELARSGAPLKGVVSFHGGLATKNPGDAKNIKGRVLALHGADDPFVKDAEVRAFEDEMRAAQVDWELVKYGNAVHAFTVKGAGNDNSKGAAYNEKADHRSWQEMKTFFGDIFEEPASMRFR